MIISLMPDLGIHKGIIDFPNAPVGFITPFAQELIAGGIFLFFIMWGAAKLIHALRRKD